MKKRVRTPTLAEEVLGKELAKLRRIKAVNARDLARTIRETEQQIRRYEAGAFIPLPVLEALTEALGEPIQKRDIRRMSNLRKLEMEGNDVMDELVALYQELFEDVTAGE